MAEISKITLPSGNTYDLKDSNAYRKSETYTKAEVEQAIANAIKGGYLAVNELPSASEDTLGHIYLVPGQNPHGQNIKIEYVTVASGTTPETYYWEELGTTELDLSNLGDLAYEDTVTLNKGNGDDVLGESTTFTNSSSSVTFSGGGTDTFVKSYTGTTSKLATTTVPNVTNAGSASTWSFAMGTGANAETLIISGANGSAPTLGTAKTVATGSLASNGGGDSVMTGLGTPDTGTAVTSVGTGTAAAQTITVGTNDKVKIAKYGDLSITVS